MADQAYLKCGMEFVPGGLKFKLKGYNDKFLSLIEKVFKEIKQYNVIKKHGERIYEIMKQKMINEL